MGKWLALALLAAGCLRTTSLGPPADAGAADSGSAPTVAVSGRVCTAPTAPNAFPVKVVLLIDQSSAMCLTDPGGPGNGTPLCNLFADGGTPARALALQALAAQLPSTAQLALITFETNPRQLWPAGGGFARPDALFTQVTDQLGSTEGLAADWQGALALAEAVVEADVVKVSRSDPELLPRSRYLVLMVTDGVPSPRCSADDAMGSYASASDPSLTWADTDPLCNDGDAGTVIGGFVPGTDRNQNYQLFESLDHLRALQSQFHLGDVRFHQVLLFNGAALAACGAPCQDAYGTYAGETPDHYADAAHAVARWLGPELTTRTGGSFEEFDDQAIAGFGFSGFDLRSLVSQNLLAALFAQPRTATLAGGEYVSDLDGDGLPDALEADAGTSPILADTDGDGFDDHYELGHEADGFDPLLKDARGCDPSSPQTAGCISVDTDGDGLSQYAEAFFGTSVTTVDSDLDLLPDGLEVRWGLDPLVPNTGDSDGDGVGDVSEVQRGTDPKTSDAALLDKLGAVLATTAEPPDANGSTCYDFTLSHLPVAATPEANGLPKGFNLLQLWFAEAPARAPQALHWRSACVATRLNGQGALAPPQVGDAAFLEPYRLALPSAWPASCVGWVAAGGPSP